MKRQRTPAAAALIAGLLLAFAPFAVATTEAQQATDPRVADLVRVGKLRVGLFLPQYGKDPSGLSTTVWVEAARAHAARVGIPLAIVEHATPPEAIACLKAGACDQLFLPLDARAAAIGEFSNPIFQFDYTLMVPAASSITKIADADRPGVRIAAVRNHASTNELVRQVKQAELVYAETPESTLDLIRNGQADVMASTRLVLLDFSTGSPEHVCWTIATAQTSIEWSSRKARRVAHVNEFVEDAKASGAAQKFIERGGTRGFRWFFPAIQID